MNCDRNDKHRFIFVIGAPGAGKGTLSKELAQTNGFAHISVGDLLRKNAEDEPEIDRHVKSGELLPMDFLLPVLRDAFRGCPAECPIIVDGFPRRFDQMSDFEKAFGPPHLVLFFQCPRDLAKQRVVNRKQGRRGDTAEVFDKRYKEYLELNPAVLDYYGSTRGKGILVEVNSSREVSVSYNSLRDALGLRKEWPELTGSPHSPPPAGSQSSDEKDEEGEKDCV